MCLLVQWDDDLKPFIIFKKQNDLAILTAVIPRIDRGIQTMYCTITLLCLKKILRRRGYRDQVAV